MSISITKFDDTIAISADESGTVYVRFIDPYTGYHETRVVKVGQATQYVTVPRGARPSVVFEERPTKIDEAVRARVDAARRVLERKVTPVGMRFGEERED